MAFPTIPTTAAGRVLTTTQANTTATRTFPSLSSLTKNSGDLLIAIIACYQTTSGTNAAFSSWGGGFNEFHDTATDPTLAMGAAYKWSDGTETGTFTVTQGATVVGHAAMILLSIPGAHLSTPPEAGSRASNGAAAANPASFNPTGWATEDTLWIAVGGIGETSTSGSFTGMGSAPTNFTNYVETAISADAVGGMQLAVAFRQNATGAEDVGTFTLDTSSALNGAFVIAVRPLPEGPNEGSASGAISWVGSATGARPSQGSASGSISWVGSATGEAPSEEPNEGSASGSITWGPITATGAVMHKGDAASGTVSWVGSATGARPSEGAATGSIAWAGSATGAAVHQGSATGAVAWAGSATGQAVHQGGATGALSWVGSATGARESRGSATGAILWDGFAIGDAPGGDDPDPPVSVPSIPSIR